MSQLDYLVKLKTNLIDFFDELIELLPSESDLVVVRIFLKDQIPIQDIMNYIIATLIPLKPLVTEKNDDFFLDNNILFERLDSNKVNHFKRLWLDKSFDDENKDTMWRWFESFIYLAEKYVDAGKK